MGGLLPALWRSRRSARPAWGRVGPALWAWALVAVATATVGARGWQRLATLPGPAPHVLQVVAVDLDGDGAAELVVLGRHYEQKTDDLWVLRCRAAEGATCAPAGTPPARLTGPLGHVALAAGDLTGDGRIRVLTAGAGRLTLWTWDPQGWQATWEGSVEAPVEYAAAVRVPGLTGVVAMVVVHTQPLWHHRLTAYHWAGSGFEPLMEPVRSGPVRAMAALDLVGDGQSELVLEVGEGSQPGSLHVWRWEGSSFQRRLTAPSGHAAAFALAAGAVHPPLRPREQLLVADNRGQVALYGWEEGGFTRVGGAPTLGWSLVSAAAGDLDGDGVAEAVVVEYPNWLHLLRWQP